MKVKSRAHCCIFCIHYLAFDQAEQKNNRVTRAITITHGTQHMGRSGRSRSCSCSCSCYPYCCTVVVVRVATTAATPKITTSGATWGPEHRRWGNEYEHVITL